MRVAFMAKRPSSRHGRFETDARISALAQRSGGDPVLRCNMRGQRPACRNCSRCAEQKLLGWHWLDASEIGAQGRSAQSTSWQ